MHLYAIEAGSYLVDFTHHFEHAPPTPPPEEAVAVPLVPPPRPGSPLLGGVGEGGRAASCFVFYEACVRIITELAISG